MNIEPVAVFHSPLKEKFGLPRQSGLAPALSGEVRFVPPYDSPDAVRGLDGFDYCWLIWGFSLNGPVRDSLTVRPPRLGGNERVGVFASRSPFRPNPIGLSCVKIDSIGDGVLYVSGADLADGTPVFDVKPYVEYSDSRSGVRNGFIDSTEWHELQVVISPDVAGLFTEEDREALRQVLAQDPRPQYQDDPDRVYGMIFGSFNIKFRVVGNVLLVESAEKC